MTLAQERGTRAAHGARPVPVTAAAPPHWTTLAPPDGNAGWSPSPAPLGAAPRVPDDRAQAVQLARGPLRQWATTPVVGVQGGAGRTTVTRLLGRAFASVRKAKIAAVDAAPLWGGLTAALAGDPAARWTVRDLAAAPWPPRQPVDQLLQTAFSADGPVPTVCGAPARAGWPNSKLIDEAVRRASALVDLTLVDTVADPASAPVRDWIWQPRITPVWVCPATRAGLWGVGEAIGFFEQLGAQQLTARSVVAVVGQRRHWPAEAAAAEVQLTGRDLEIIRIPYSANPLHDRRCAHAAIRLLAAVVARSG